MKCEDCSFWHGTKPIGSNIYNLWGECYLLVSNEHQETTAVLESVHGWDWNTNSFLTTKNHFCAMFTPREEANVDAGSQV